MRRKRRNRWSTNGKQERARRAIRSHGMGRLDTAKAAKLRMLAEQFRRRANEMTLLGYVRMMQQAATDLEAEAESVEDEQPTTPGRHLDISV